MNFLDQLFLMGTAMALVFALGTLGNRMRNREEGSSSDYYHGVALAVLGMAALLKYSGMGHSGHHG